MAAAFGISEVEPSQSQNAELKQTLEIRASATYYFGGSQIERRIVPEFLPQTTD